ncbi:hypothetical protein Aduo_015589 [Ancylostoma duodenale]
MADAEILLNVLNLMAIARSQGRAGRQEKPDLCIELAMEVQWFGIAGNATRRRERILISFGVESLKIVHSSHRFPVEKPIRSAHLPWNKVCPALIGSKLTIEIVGESQCRKLTEALVKKASSKKSHSSDKKKLAMKRSFERLVIPFSNHPQKLDSEAKAKAGRLSLFLSNWEELTLDPGF